MNEPPQYLTPSYTSAIAKLHGYILKVTAYTLSHHYSACLHKSASRWTQLVHMYNVVASVQEFQENLAGFLGWGCTPSLDFKCFKQLHSSN